MNVSATARGAIGSQELVPHDSGCRLAVEVSARLQAISMACRFDEIEPKVALQCIKRLAGWAGQQLGVILEYGCSCRQQRAP